MSGSSARQRMAFSGECSSKFRFDTGEADGDEACEEKYDFVGDGTFGVVDPASTLCVEAGAGAINASEAADRRVSPGGAFQTSASWAGDRATISSSKPAGGVTRKGAVRFLVCVVGGSIGTSDGNG